jgi:FMN phosphatase YigB (HAD superfamily)
MKLLFENWKKYLNESKLRVFDFDDTIAKSDSNIHITTDTGEKIQMTPGEYATHKTNPNYDYDFSEFEKVINPREIKQITNIIRNALNAGTEGREIAVLTARGPESEAAIQDYLESLGLDTSKITFELLASSNPEDKASWIANRIERGATDVLFFDDSGKNVEAVQSLQSKYPDIKIKARKVKYAKDIDENLVSKNDIIQ